jgi:hypothetical protein
MAIKILKRGDSAPVPLKAVLTIAQTKKPRNTHTRTQAPVISLDMPGRLRVGNLMALLGISHSVFYVAKKAGKIPPPDGNDSRPYWNTATVRSFLLSAALVN